MTSYLLNSNRFYFSCDVRGQEEDEEIIRETTPRLGWKLYPLVVIQGKKMTKYSPKCILLDWFDSNGEINQVKRVVRCLEFGLKLLTN